MGIRGLSQYFAQNGINGEIQVLPAGSTLLVDANGLLFYLADIANELNLIPRQYGGDYAIFDSLVRSTITRYLEAGLVVVAYFDGTSRLNRDTIAARRNESRAKEWGNLY